MKITNDYSNIKEYEKKLINKGYGEITVHSLHFDRYVSEEQREINRKFFYDMIDAEKESYYKSTEFENVQKAFLKSLREVLDIFVDKFNIHQVSSETSTMEHYKSDWDLFFWSDRGWNNEDYMTCFSLTFNDNRNSEQNMKLLEEIIAMLNTIQNDNVCCRIQYEAVLYKDAIPEAAKKIFKEINGKFVSWRDYVGKFKIVNYSDNMIEYGFFKKGAKRRYYKVSDIDLLECSSI